MASFLEGVESILLACSLVILIPTLLLVLVAKAGRAWLVGGAIVGTSSMMWARAGRIWEFESNGSFRWVISGLILATFVGAFRADDSTPSLRFGLGIVAGLVAGWLWQPCVGEHLAEILNRAETDRVESLVKMHAYVAGIFLPAILTAALPQAAPAAARVLNHDAIRRTSLAIVGIYAAAVAVGWYDDLVGELFRISSR